MIKYRSGLEEKVANLLTELDISFEYEAQKLSYTIEHTYCPDFTLPNGIILETKGLWEPDDRRKILAVKKAHPDCELRMVFQSPFNKISKKSKTTYAKWCEKHDIPWCSYANIPLEWLIGVPKT